MIEIYFLCSIENMYKKIKEKIIFLLEDFKKECSKAKFYFFVIFLAQASIIGLGLWLGFLRNNLDKHFGEAGFVTWFSFFNLLFVAFIATIVANNLYWLGKKDKESQVNRYLFWSWLIIALGFLFLSFDEILMIHEKTKKSFHSFFQIKANDWTNRLDDLMVFLYAIILIIWIYMFRHNIRLFGKVKYFIFLALFFFVIMVYYDYLGKGLTQYDKKTLYAVYEESAKIIAEGFFLLSAMHCLKITERLRGKEKK